MLRKISLLLALTAASLAQTAKSSKALPAPTSGQTIVLRGGKLLTITHGVIENGVLVMQNGKITAVGAAGSVSIPNDAKLMDVTGMTVYPGLIDSETHLGLTEVSADQMLMVRDIAMPLNFTGRQRRNEGPSQTHKFPSTRMGMAAQLRQAFLDALRYEQRMAARAKQKSDDGNESQEERGEGGEQGER